MRSPAAPCCWIVGAGDFCARDFSPAPNDLIAAADGGLVHLERLGRRADVVVGDFDSLGRAPDVGEVVRLPTEKDVTDALAAVQLGLLRGYRLFRIYGGTGGRLDHTVANLQVLSYLSLRGARGILVDESCSMTAITDAALDFDAASTGVLSVFAALGGARGVALRGLKYVLDNWTLSGDDPLGVSNRFIGAPARVSVHSGTLLISYAPTAMERAVPRYF